MKKIEKLSKALNSYFKEIHKIYITGNFREESFYPCLKTLIEECSYLLRKEDKTRVLIQPKKTEVGIPDFLIRTNGEIIGNIEAKTPDENLSHIEDTEQLKRYRSSLPNLILTNFLEFRLYRYDNLIDKVEVGRQFTLQRLEYPPVPEKLENFFKVLEKFFSFSTPEIKKSSELSIELARRTRLLEHILQEELESSNPEVTRFFEAFQQELIETLTKERFADLYAQTITYGLFAARMRASSEERFKRELAWKFIPQSLPLLKEIFCSFTGPHFPESLSWIVDEITQILEKADVKSILEEFKITRWEEDPVIHFYETFLTTYNPQERKRLGVFYTSLPVVSYITRSIHKLLEEKFGKSEGLSTRDVTLLDPAAGTLTFVVQAIKQVKKELEENDYIKFIRFAHWKIDQAGRGILGFITNNSYLSGVIHRGMRRKLLETFDEIYILNLHGSSRIGEKTPEGGKDENVFDIQQGVAIALFAKYGED